MSLGTRGGKREGAGRKPGPTSQHAQEFAKARARKEIALAEIREMEAAKVRGELIELAIVREDWINAINIAKSRFLALPSRLGPEVANLTDIRAIEEIILSEVHEILEELAGAYGQGD